MRTFCRRPTLVSLAAHPVKAFEDSGVAASMLRPFLDGLCSREETQRDERARDESCDRKEEADKRELRYLMDAMR